MLLVLMSSPIDAKKQDFCMANSPPGRVWVSVEDSYCFNGTSTDLSNEFSYAFGSGIEGEGYAGTT